MKEKRDAVIVALGRSAIFIKAEPLVLRSLRIDACQRVSDHNINWEYSKWR